MNLEKVTKAANQIQKLITVSVKEGKWGRSSALSLLHPQAVGGKRRLVRIISTVTRHDGNCRCITTGRNYHADAITVGGVVVEVACIAADTVYAIGRNRASQRGAAHIPVFRILGVHDKFIRRS